MKVLPQITLYRPGHGQLLQFQSVPSKLKVAKKNISKILEHPTKFFKLDPNGMVTVLDEDPSPQQAQAKQDAQKLKASTGGLFEKLMSSAGVRCSFYLVPQHCNLPWRCCNPLTHTAQVLSTESR